jgi:predicted membrane protein
MTFDIFISLVAIIFSLVNLLMFTFTKDFEKSTHYGIAALWFLLLSGM